MSVCGLTEGRRGLCEVGGGGACSSLPAAGSFVVGVPVLLLALDGAVGGVPAAVVHGLLLAVITLKTHKHNINIYMNSRCLF